LPGKNTHIFHDAAHSGKWEMAAKNQRSVDHCIMDKLNSVAQRFFSVTIEPGPVFRLI
jgi:hypothetical protein